ncbi:MAG: Gfo/Idh/MocA family oxidoreductase [Planctomycetota bacterium]|nr:Gfo/Idh/MocA family oxidoreductase [Planctomycetota bacterium]
MAAKIRLGIVGVGGVGAGRVKNAADTPEAEVTAVCDVNAQAVEDARKLCPSAQPFSDAEKLFASGQCEAVLLNLPHFLHKPLAVAALQAGLHVLVEKPMAIRIGECDAMLAMAQKAKKLLTVHHQKRIGQRHVAKLVREGGLGELARVTCIRNNIRSNYYYSTGAWRGTWKYEGGGVLINQAIHDIDALLNVTGQVAEVRAKLGNLFHNIETEDTCTAALEYPNGATGTFVANVSSLLPRRRLAVRGRPRPPDPGPARPAGPHRGRERPRLVRQRGPQRQARPRAESRMAGLPRDRTLRARHAGPRLRPVRPDRPQAARRSRRRARGRALLQRARAQPLPRQVDPPPARPGAGGRDLRRPREGQREA